MFIIFSTYAVHNDMSNMHEYIMAILFNTLTVHENFGNKFPDLFFYSQALYTRRLGVRNPTSCIISSVALGWERGREGGCVKENKGNNWNVGCL